MDYNMYVYNLDYVKVCNLYNNQGTSPRNVILKKTVNEISELTFDIPFTNPNIQYIINSNLIEFEGQIYEIVTPTRAHSDSEAALMNVSCRHYSWSLKCKQIVDLETDPLLPIDALKAILYEGSTPRYGWTVGTITSPSIYRYFQFTEQTAFEALGQIAETFNSYFFFDARIVNGAMLAVVNMYDKDNIGAFEPVYIDINKNLKNVSVDYDTTEMATRLYCFGGTDPSTGIEVDLFDAIVDGVPWTKTYIENYSYFIDQGYTEQYILNNPNIFLKEAVWRDSNYVDANTLYADAVTKLETLSQPKLTVTFSSVDFREYDYGLRTANIGYPVFVRDDSIGVYVQCIVTSIMRNYETPWIYEFEVSNAIDYANVLNKIMRGTNTTNITINKNGTIKPVALGDALDSIRNEIADLIAAMDEDGLTDDEQARIDQIYDDLYGDVDPSMYAFAKRSKAVLDNKAYWQLGVIASQFSAENTSIAVQKTANTPERIFVGYCALGQGYVEYTDVGRPVANLSFTTVQQFTDCEQIVVAFNGTYAYNAWKQVEFKTDDIPLVFYRNSTGALNYGELNGTFNTLVGSGVTYFDVVRGNGSLYGEIDQGLVVFYIINGTLYYNQLIGGEWIGQSTVDIAPTDLVKVHVERTFDFRLVIQCEDSAGALYEIFTKPAISGWTNIEHISAAANMTVSVYEIDYIDAQDGDEHISATANMTVAVLWGISPIMQSAYTVDNGSGDYGYKIRIAWDHDVDIMTGNDTAFLLTDSEDHTWNSISVTQITPLIIELEYYNFNNAVGECSVAYTAGTMVGEAGQAVDTQSILFTPTGLVPFEVIPPVPTGAINIIDWSVD